MIIEPPLNWTIDTHSLPAGSSSFAYSATPNECAAVSAYISAEKVQDLTAHLRVKQLAGERYHVEGKLKASIVQSSVVSLEPVPSQIEETFKTEFRAQNIQDSAPLEVSIEDDPPEALVGNSIPIGRFLCEVLAVSIDAYPRLENETFEWDGDKTDATVSPFARLATLKRTSNS